MGFAVQLNRASQLCISAIILALRSPASTREWSVSRKSKELSPDGRPQITSKAVLERARDYYRNDSPAISSGPDPSLPLSLSLFIFLSLIRRISVASCRMISRDFRSVIPARKFRVIKRIDKRIMISMAGRIYCLVISRLRVDPPIDSGMPSG